MVGVIVIVGVTDGVADIDVLGVTDIVGVTDGVAVIDVVGVGVGEHSGIILFCWHF